MRNKKIQSVAQKRDEDAIELSIVACILVLTVLAGINAPSIVRSLNCEGPYIGPVCALLAARWNYRLPSRWLPTRRRQAQRVALPQLTIWTSRNFRPSITQQLLSPKSRHRSSTRRIGDANQRMWSSLTMPSWNLTQNRGATSFPEGLENFEASTPKGRHTRPKAV
jgi:hypothetical protein